MYCRICSFTGYSSHLDWCSEWSGTVDRRHPSYHSDLRTPPTSSFCGNLPPPPLPPQQTTVWFHRPMQPLAASILNRVQPDSTGAGVAAVHCQLVVTADPAGFSSLFHTARPAIAGPSSTFSFVSPVTLLLAHPDEYTSDIRHILGVSNVVGEINSRLAV